MKIVIVSSGLGTRLHPYTKNLPKVLKIFNSKVLVYHLFDYWSKYSNDFILIINSKYQEIINFYIKNYSNKIECNVILFDKITGTADTIYQSLSKKYLNKDNLLFTWCDIVPNDSLSNIIYNNGVTIFTFGNKCRYKFIDGKILSNQKNGNIIGIYFIPKNTIDYKDYKLGDDLCDILQKYSTLKEFKLNNLIDIGDIDKYKNELKKYNSICRFFNNIEFKKNSVIKKSIHKQGDKLILNEINWYKQFYCLQHNVLYNALHCPTSPILYNQNNDFNFIPKLLSYEKKSFEIEKIEGYSLFKKFKNYDLTKKNIILDKIFDKLNILHSKTKQIKEKKYLNDINIEINIKIKNRINKILPIIEHFGEIDFVNSVQIYDCDKIFNYLVNYIRNYYIKHKNYEYSMIHGDCQFSNILIDKNENIYFIDPRGYFGNTKLYFNNY